MYIIALFIYTKNAVCAYVDTAFSLERPLGSVDYPKFSCEWCQTASPNEAPSS